MEATTPRAFASKSPFSLAVSLLNGLGGVRIMENHECINSEMCSCYSLIKVEKHAALHWGGRFQPE